MMQLDGLLRVLPLKVLLQLGSVLHMRVGYLLPQLLRVVHIRMLLLRQSMWQLLLNIAHILQTSLVQFLHIGMRLLYVLLL